MSERFNDGFDDLFAMPIVPTDNNLSAPLNQEKEIQEKKEQDKFNDGFDDLFSDSFDSPIDIPEPLSGPEPSFARKFDYGLEQEQTILGNLAQSFVAGAKSLTRSGLTFQQALRESERQRQEDIFIEYPEFKNRPEDAAVMTGRISQALADPLPWLVPWTKIAQVGRTATVGVGASFATADVALREKVLYGKVDPSSVIMAAAFGGAATYGADVIARRFRNKDLIEPEYSATTAERAATREVGEARLKEDMNILLKQGPENGDFIKDYSLKLAAYQELDSTAKITQKLNEFKELGVNVTRKQLERQAALAKIESDRAFTSFSEQSKRLLNDLDDGVAKQISDLEKIGTKVTLSDGFIRKFMYEATRPFFGGVSGAIAGSYMGEEDDDHLLYTMMGIGAGLGIWQKHVQRAGFLTAPQKKIAEELIYSEARLVTNAWLKINTAGTHAARLNAWGGASEMFGKLMYKQQGASLTGRVNMPVESRSTDKTARLFNIIHRKVVNDVPPSMLEDVGKFRNGFVSLDELGKKYSVGELEVIQNTANKVKEFTDILGESVTEVGIPFKELENYGLTQMWDWNKIAAKSDEFSYTLKQAWAVQKSKGKLDPTDIVGIDDAIKKGGKFFEQEVSAVANGLKGTRVTTVIGEDGGIIIPLLKNYEKERVIVDQNARILLQDFMVNNPAQTLAHLVKQTIPSLEFARTWGPNGELLRTVRRSIHNKYGAIRQSDNVKGRNVDKLKQKELQHIDDSVNAFFGLYGNRLSNESGHVAMAGLTMLGNSTMLTRVSVPSIGDLIQPIQNSGVLPVVKSYFSAVKATKLFGGKQDTFSEEGLGIRHLNILESELNAIGFGVDPSNKMGRDIAKFNAGFFKWVGLKKITEIARARAYDAGVYRAFAISKKVSKGGKISLSLQNEINTLSLRTEDMRKIAKFKTTREAFDSRETKEALHIAGFNASERDAIIPTVGNRLLFAQSNNPLVRSLGQFLSWAQAKTTQTNSLISRIEDGDGALALRMLTALTLYGGVRELQIAMSPSKYYQEEENVPERGSLEYGLQAARLSGNFMPFQVDKLLSLVSGPGSSEGLGGAIPSLGLVNDFINFVPQTGANLYQGDLEGILSDTIDFLPFGKDVKNILSEDKLDIIDIEDAPNSSGKSKGGRRTSRRKRPSRRKNYAKGYEVTNVPYVKENPEERINPRTGEPYTAIYKR